MINGYSALKNIKLDTLFFNGVKNSTPNIKIFRIGKSRGRKINGCLGLGRLGDLIHLELPTPNSLELQNVILFANRVFTDVIS